MITILTTAVWMLILTSVTVMAGDMIRGITVHGIIHGTVHTGIILTAGAGGIMAGAVFMADGIRPCIMTGIGGHLMVGEAITGITITIITADLITVINTDAL
jgi:hypothetical protein